MSRLSTIIIAAAASAITACQVGPRQTVSLDGEWRTELGPVKLPGTTDEAGIGDTISDMGEDSRLSRKYSLCRPLTYTGEIIIPAKMDGKHIELFIERTKPTTLWIDGDSIGSQSHLQTPHVYDISRYRSGRHTVRLRIDNSWQDENGDGALPPAIMGSHAMTEATQTNWNGAVGQICLRSTPRTYINDLKITTKIDTTTIGRDEEGRLKADTAVASVEMEIIAQQSARVSIDVKCLPHPATTGAAIAQTATTTQVNLKKGLNKAVVDVVVTEALLWSEWNQALYDIDVTLDSPDGVDKTSEVIGFRTFEARGPQFAINGETTFLRGKHDACVFPLTGYAPMDKESWLRVFRTAKEYGINHYRFHSWCPPEAAFAAADEVGIYLQPELPYWGEMKPSGTDEATRRLNNFLFDEGLRIVRQYGNHPSFVMMSLGNELGGDTTVMRQMINGLRKADQRHLYAAGSNNFLGWMGTVAGEDFYVSCRTGWSPEPYGAHVRASFSLADAEEFGILNGTYPNTRTSFAKAASGVKVPIVGHETGQYQVYPDYDEIKKYTGVMRPLNLENFRKALSRTFTDCDVDSLAKVYNKASGALSAACYKADIEMNLRTPEFGGFQLLDLQDYPGQGGALVGMLDPFMESKGIISAEEWRGFCSDIVPLALMDKYTYTSAEEFKADVAIANYSEQNIEGDTVRWAITRNGDKSAVAAGRFKAAAPAGGLTTTGAIVTKLDAVESPSQLKLEITIGKAHNTYNIWVYPDNKPACGKRKGFIKATSLTDAIINQVEMGATLLLTPDHKAVEKQSVGGMFIPDYWNYAMFKTISENNGKPVSAGTLGYLIDTRRGLFQEFPSESHSDFQWWDIMRNSRPLILDGTPSSLNPEVSAIDNVNRNHKLGVVFGVKIGLGKVLVCMTDLNAIKRHPEGRAWACAVENYAASDKFHPTYMTSGAELRRLLTREIEQANIEGVKNISDYKEKK